MKSYIENIGRKEFSAPRVMAYLRNRKICRPDPVTVLEKWAHFAYWLRLATRIYMQRGRYQ